MERSVASSDGAAESQNQALLETAAAVRKLAEVMQDHGLAKIEVSQGGIHILLSAGKPANVATLPLTATPVASPSAPSEPEGHFVTAPMIGTYYASPSPGDPPFVQVGDAVEVGQTIGIIEAMKIMNEIASDRSGVVAEVFVANSQAVEYGSPLIRIVPA
jgi:acetyl-CoA carboxylase biotin carboxyl carrier protein